MKTLSIDIETFSSAPLTKCGVYKYVEAPDFEILLFGYSADGEPVRVVDLACGESIPDVIISALSDETVTKWAYNANFERVCLSRFIGLTPGEYLDPEGYKLGIASNHGDVMHWFPRFGKSMDIFRAEVGRLLAASAPTPTPAPSGFAVGDRVVLNGAVYADSYGGGKGRYFQNRTCTVTRVVDLKRKCPYLLDNGLGWVPKDIIRKT